MTKKVWALIALAVALGAISFYLNKDGWTGGTIQLQISDRSRPEHLRSARARATAQNDSQTDPVHFTLNRELKLTEIKVVPLSAIQTNKYPDPIWHLISDSNSVPTSGFAYGQRIKGMRTSVRGATPDALEPGVPYRLSVAAGPVKAEHDFIPEARTQ
ncbi:MAG: hypothetical protein C5B50_16235 [Verrucomicrobia bacterium]|nr:MAG: hypothetical protein C5B50_16235 [Verrucomicrobiota bacterium]